MVLKDLLLTLKIANLSTFAHLNNMNISIANSTTSLMTRWRFVTTGTMLIVDPDPILWLLLRCQRLHLQPLLLVILHLGSQRPQLPLTRQHQWILQLLTRHLERQQQLLKLQQALFNQALRRRLQITISGFLIKSWLSTSSWLMTLKTVFILRMNGSQNYIHGNRKELTYFSLLS